MTEELETPNPERREPQPKETIHYLELLADHGIDFEASDLDYLKAMDDGELTAYLYQALLEAGEEEPEIFMVEHNLVEGFRELTPEELEARKSRELRGEGYKVDELDRQGMGEN